MSHDSNMDLLVVASAHNLQQRLLVRACIHNHGHQERNEHRAISNQHPSWRVADSAHRTGRCPSAIWQMHDISTLIYKRLHRLNKPNSDLLKVAAELGLETVNQILAIHGLEKHSMKWVLLSSLHSMRLCEEIPCR